MPLRHNNTLRLLALILFSLELVAPSLIPVNHAKHHHRSSIHWLDVQKQSNLLTILAEENALEEERKTNDDSVIVPTVLFAAFFEFVSPHTLQSSFLIRDERSLKSLPLFKIHCIYLI